MPLTYDIESQTVLARADEREGLNVEFRWRKVGDEGWQYPTNNGDSFETWQVIGGGYDIEVEARLQYSVGFDEWAPFCQPLTIPLAENAIIVEPLAPNQPCPPFNRGRHKQFWLDPVTGKMFQHYDIFSFYPDQSTMTPEGQRGVLWRADDLTFRGSDTTDYQWYRETADLTGKALLNPDLAEADGVTAFNVDQIVYWTATTTTSPDRARRMSFRTAINGVFKSGDELKPEIEEQMFVAFEFANGRRSYVTFEDDDDEPYLSEIVAFAQLYDDQFTGGVVSSVKAVMGRLDKRCEGNPVNPWQPVVDLGDEGIDGLGVEFLYSVAPTNASIPQSELPSSLLPYNAAVSEVGEDVGVRIVNGERSTASTGGRVWHDSEQQTTAENPWLVVVFREVPGRPENGAESRPEWSPWSAPIFRKTFAQDGVTYETETIWGAHTEDTLAANQMPLDTWTLQQVADGATIDRNGVVWATSLEASGFGAAKEYGFRADRQHDALIAIGGDIAEDWVVKLDAHWGIPGVPGVISRFVYSDIGSLARPGGYSFYEGGTIAAGSGTNVAGVWRKIKDADYLEVGRYDRNGWPCLEWDDLTSDDFIVYEPSSSQWVAFDISEVAKIEGGYRIGIARTRRVSDGGGADVSIAAGVLADFYLSVDRRPLPPNLQGSAIYNGSQRAGTFDENRMPNWMESDNGYFGFFNSKSLRTPVESTGADIVLDQFHEVVKGAIYLRMNLNDEHGNLFDSLRNLVANRDYVAMFLLDSGHLDRLDSWAAWRITAVTLTDTLAALDIDLVSFRANRASDIQQFPSVADVQFFVSPPRLVEEVLTVRIVDYYASSGATANTIPAGGLAVNLTIEALLGGSAASPEAQSAPPEMRVALAGALAMNVVNVRDGSSVAVRVGDTGDYTLSTPVIEGRKVTGVIGFPQGIGEDVRLMVALNMTATYPNGEVFRASDNHVITQVRSDGTHLSPPSAPVLTSSGGAFFIPQPAPQPDQAQWEFQWGTTNNADDYETAGTIAPSGDGVTIRGDDVVVGRTYYARVRAIGDGSRTYTSRWSDFGSIVVTNTVKLPELDISVPPTQPSSVTSAYVTRARLHANATGWEYEYTDSASRDFSGATRRTGGGTVGSATYRQIITGLTRGTAYWVRARQITTQTGYTTSEWSAPVQVVAGDRVFVPQVRVVTDLADRKATFSLDRPDSSADNWQLVFGTDPDVWKETPIDQDVITANIEVSSINDVPLTLGQIYYFSARTRTSANVAHAWTRRGTVQFTEQLPKPTVTVTAGRGTITITISGQGPNVVGWYYVYSNRSGTGRSAEGFLGIEDAIRSSNSASWHNIFSTTQISVTINVPTADTYYAAAFTVGGLGYRQSMWSDTASSTVRNLLATLRTPVFNLDAGNTVIRVNRTSAMPADAHNWSVRHRTRSRTFDNNGNLIGSPTFGEWEILFGVGRSNDFYDIRSLTNFRKLADNTAGTQVDYGVEVKLRAEPGSATTLDSDWADEQYALPSVDEDIDTPVGIPTFSVAAGDEELVVTLTGVPVLDANATGWEVDWGTGTLDGDGVDRTVSQTSYTIPGLTNGTSYAVRVRALSTTTGYTNSPWSPPQSQTPVGEDEPPGKPTLSLDAGDGQYTINISGLASGATRWEWREGTSASAVTRAASTRETPSTTSRDVTSRNNGTTYYVQARQSTAAGDSEWTDAIAVTPQAPGSPLTAPNGTTAPGDRSAIVRITSAIPSTASNWQARIGRNATELVGATTANGRLATIATSTTSHTFSNLVNNTAYRVQIRLLHSNAAQNSTWRNLDNVTPEAKTPLPSPNLALTAGNRRLTVAIRNLNANADGGWEFDWATNSGFTGAQTVRSTRSQLSRTLTNRTNGTAIYVRGRQLAGNAPRHADSPNSTAVNATPVAPLSTLGISLASNGRGTVGVTRDALGTGATGWQFEWSNNRTTVSSGRGTRVNINNTTTTLRNLGNLTLTDTIYVRARETSTNAAYEDEGAWSRIESIRVGKTKLPRLSMRLSSGNALVTIERRTNLHAQANGWQYRVATSQSGLSSANWRTVSPSTSSTANATGLNNNTPYWFQIRQTTSNAAFEASDPSTAASATPIAAPVLDFILANEADGTLVVLPDFIEQGYSWDAQEAGTRAAVASAPIRYREHGFTTYGNYADGETRYVRARQRTNRRSSDTTNVSEWSPIQSHTLQRTGPKLPTPYICYVIEANGEARVYLRHFLAIARNGQNFRMYRINDVVWADKANRRASRIVRNTSDSAAVEFRYDVRSATTVAGLRSATETRVNPTTAGAVLVVTSSELAERRYVQVRVAEGAGYPVSDWSDRIRVAPA